ncbi:hypothetical protein [Pseudomonas asiatica]|uniref:hypothetical protein n=1 Tax=Pseudomonas asiatica TaxID=2219225 RepID=UPI003877E37A
MKTPAGIMKGKRYPYKGKTASTTATRADQNRTSSLKRSDFTIHPYQATTEAPNYNEPLRTAITQALLKYHQRRIKSAQLENLVFHVATHVVARYGHSPNRLVRKAISHLASGIEQALNRSSSLETTYINPQTSNRLEHHQKNTFCARNYYWRNPEKVLRKIATEIKKDQNPNSLCSQNYLVDLVSQLLNEHNDQTAAIQNLPVTSRSTLLGFIKSPVAQGVEVFTRLPNPPINNRRNMYQSPAFQPWRVITDTTALDILVCNEHRQLCGRPWLTLTQDQSTGLIIEWEVTYDPPSILSPQKGLCALRFIQALPSTT